MPNTHLYYVQAEVTDEIGDRLNMDLVVEANDPAQALELWREFYADDSVCGSFISEALADLTIWTMPERTGKPCSFAWHTVVRPADLTL